MNQNFFLLLFVKTLYGLTTGHLSILRANAHLPNPAKFSLQTCLSATHKFQLSSPKTSKSWTSWTSSHFLIIWDFQIFSTQFLKNCLRLKAHFLISFPKSVNTLLSLILVKGSSYPLQIFVEQLFHIKICQKVKIPVKQIFIYNLFFFYFSFS